MRNTFRFSPELLECANDVSVALADAGYEWLSDYSSVAPIQDLYGIEVCGIKCEEDAAAIRTIVERMFPSWRYRRHFYWECIETGWKVEVHRDQDRDYENWLDDG